MAEQITKIVSDNEKISWGSRSFYVVRNDVLQEVFKYKYVEIGEKYCTITQTPSTPPDFGLLLREKKECDNIYGIPDDTDIRDVVDYMVINPINMKEFILGTKEFKNWYEQ